jgi:hypothetical protein
LARRNCKIRSVRFGCFFAHLPLPNLRLDSWGYVCKSRFAAWDCEGTPSRVKLSGVSDNGFGAEFIRDRPLVSLPAENLPQPVLIRDRHAAFDRRVESPVPNGSIGKHLNLEGMEPDTP